MVLVSPTGAAVGRMSSPPVPPPETPTLSAFRPNQDEGQQGPGPGQVGALPKLFFQASQALDTIASAAPTIASDIDNVKASLRDLLRKVISSGASNSKPNPPAPGEEGLPGFGA